MKVQYLSIEDIIEIHDSILTESGDSPGVFSWTLLDLCIKTPSQFFYGFEPFDSIISKAASLYHEIAKLHPFIDGNKRTAHFSAVTFLGLNGYKFRPEKEDAVSKALDVAICSIGIEELSCWIQGKSRKKPYTTS